MTIKVVMSKIITYFTKQDKTIYDDLTIQSFGRALQVDYIIFGMDEKNFKPKTIKRIGYQYLN